MREEEILQKNKFGHKVKSCIIAVMGNRTTQERRRIVKQVQKAVTPRIQKKDLANKLDMTRQTLDNRLNNADFTESEIRMLEKLKIIPKQKTKSTPLD